VIAESRSAGVVAPGLAVLAQGRPWFGCAPHRWVLTARPSGRRPWLVLASAAIVESRGEVASAVEPVATDDDSVGMSAEVACRPCVGLGPEVVDAAAGVVVVLVRSENSVRQADTVAAGEAGEGGEGGEAGTSAAQSMGTGRGCMEASRRETEAMHSLEADMERDSRKEEAADGGAADKTVGASAALRQPATPRSGSIRGTSPWGEQYAGERHPCWAAAS
jgi:hypothetical protein